MPIAIGGVATIQGARKFVFELSGNYQASDEVPTSISGTVLATVNYAVGEDVFSQDFIAAVDFTEGIATLDLKNLNNPEIIKRLNEGIGILNLTIDAASLPENLRNVLYNNSPGSNSAANDKNPIPIDNTYVTPPIIPFNTNSANEENNAEDTKEYTGNYCCFCNNFYSQ